MKKELGWIGFGEFGKFFIPHLNDFFEITVYNRSNKEDKIKKIGAIPGTLEETASKEYILICIPMQYLEETLKKITPHIKENSTIMDVTSVKVEPVKLMKKYLPKNTNIIATHPLFGPQSGKEGISGLNLVLYNVQGNKLKEIEELFSKKLWLNVIKKTPQEHDKEMAIVQGLTHFISRTLNELQLPLCNQRTTTYEKLLAIENLLSKDTWELFDTIQNHNPYAKKIRKQFLNKLNEIEGKLEKN